jgi:hypothetical protein
MINVFEIGCERHEMERPKDMVDEIADCLLEDHMALMTENAAMRKQLAAFQSAAEHVTEDGCTRRSFVASEGWAMIHKDRLAELENAEERLAAAHKSIRRVNSQAEEFERKFYLESDRAEKQEQQLAAALAACKVKDEALIFIYDNARDPFTSEKVLRKALAIQPDDSALLAWLGEPRSYLYKFNSEFGDGVRWSHRPTHNGSNALETIPLYAPKGMK